MCLLWWALWVPRSVCACVRLAVFGSCLPVAAPFKALTPCRPCPHSPLLPLSQITDFASSSPLQSMRSVGSLARFSLGSARSLTSARRTPTTSGPELDRLSAANDPLGRRGRPVSGGAEARGSGSSEHIGRPPQAHSVARRIYLEREASGSGGIEHVARPVSGPVARLSILEDDASGSGSGDQIGRPPAACSIGRRSILEQEACGVCLDHMPNMMVRGCSHSLCSSCATSLCELVRDKPLLCPFCRGVVLGFTAVGLAAGAGGRGGGR